jgi:hypothetical protein
VSLIKEGQYKVHISATDWMPNKAATGHYLRISFKITSHAEYDDKTLYEYLNFDNPSEGAVEVARNKWKTLCYCAKLGNLEAPNKQEPSTAVKKQLMYAELAIDLRHDPKEDGRTFYKIKRYLPFDTKEANSNAPSSSKQGKEQPPKDEAPPPSSDEYNFLDDNIPF